MQRRKIDARIADALAQKGFDAPDLSLARQKDEDGAGFGTQGPQDGFRDLVVDPAVRVAAEIARFDRKGPALQFDDFRLAQELCDASAVEGGRHHEEAKVFPQTGLRVERQREPEIGVEGTLVELVEKDCPNPFEGRIGDDHPGEHAFGDDFDAGPAADLRAEPDPQPDRLADALVKRAGHPVRCRTRCEPSGLEEDELAPREPGLVEEEERHAGRLAGAGRRDEDGVRAGAKRGAKIRQHRVDRKGRIEGAHRAVMADARREGKPLSRRECRSGAVPSGRRAVRHSGWRACRRHVHLPHWRGNRR